MRIPRIFTPEPLLQEESATALTGSSANHIARVLRMKVSGKIRVFNGKGGYWLAEIISVTRQQVNIHLIEYFSDNKESPLKVSLGQCLSRGERMDYVIQKATEMGVTSITPLFSERCEVKLDAERQEKRLRHWRQMAISACEQCGRNIIPTIHSPVHLEHWVTQINAALKLVLHHRTDKLLSAFERPRSVSLLIGPEGGLSSREIILAEQYGFYPAALGPRVLRTETAPVAVTALLQYLWGDWQA